MKLKLFAPFLAAFSLMSLAQANDTVDIAVALIGFGNQSATFACADGTSLNAAFEIRADLGPTVVMSQSGRELYKLPRYLKPSDFQINQTITGQAYDGSSAVTVFLKSPTEIESIELGYMMGRQFKVTHRCSVRAITYVK